MNKILKIVHTIDILTSYNSKDIRRKSTMDRESTPIGNMRLKLLKDLDSIGLPLDFNLDLRGYSKIYEGRYDSAKKLMILYVLEEDGTFIPYSDIIRVAIHECVHHIQWVHDPNFVRLKGVMHNNQFKGLLKIYTSRYNELKESVC